MRSLRHSSPIRRLLLSFVLGVGFASAALWARGVPEERETMVVRYPRSVSSIPVLALLEDYPEEYDGDFFTDHPQALAQLITGETDLLVTGFTVGYSRARAAGDVVHVTTPVWGASAIMARSGITEIEDLAGTTVYAPFEGSPIDLTLRRILDAEGVSEQVEIAYAPFPQAVALLLQGDADAAVLVEPLASRLEGEGRAIRVANLHDAWAPVTGGEPRSPQVSVFARSDWSREETAGVRRFAARLGGYVQAVQNDPAGYAERYAPVLGFSAAIVERAIRNTWFEVPDDETNREIITGYTRELSLPPPANGFFLSH